MGWKARWANGWIARSAYEALIQARIPVQAARRVAEALEKDMDSNLATKLDMQHHEQLMATRLEALESRVSLMLESMESRLVAKLGAMMTLLVGLAGAVLALVR